MEIAGRRKRRTRNSCGSGHSSSLTAAKTALAVAGIVGAVVTSGSVDCLGFRVGAYVWHSVHGGFLVRRSRSQTPNLSTFAQELWT